MSNTDYQLLDSAVKQIVHPSAAPTQAMVNIAYNQGRPPSTTQDVMEYVPHLQDLARQMGVKPPGSKGTVPPHVLNNYIMSRANQWLQQYNMRGGAGGALFGSNSGNWLMRFMLFDQFLF